MRSFNPLVAPFAQHIGLLTSMAEIHPPWREGLQRGAEALQQQRESRHQQAADYLVQYLQAVLQYKLQLPVIGAKEAIRDTGFREYNRELQRRERNMQQKIAALYGYHELDWESEWRDLQAADLTDAHEWRAWGLPRRRLASLSAAAGAMSGLAVDAAVGGSSLLMGALAGGTLGALAGGFAGRDPLTFELVSKVPGYEQWQLGPVANLEFAVALVGRALRSWYQIRLRNHARRDALMLESQNLAVWLEGLPRKQQVQLMFWLKKLMNAPLNESQQNQFRVLLLALGEQMDSRAET